ncbi:MAG: cytochrome c [Pseudobdellovibrionaceae bacterium]|nr:cytochrome c [Pseudobdellovibrionaceae bacterium]
MRLGFWMAWGSLALATQLGAADWTQDASIPREGRPNILQLDPQQQAHYVHKGWQHSLNYPVQVTGVTVPLELLQDLLIDTYETPLRKLLQQAFKALSGIRTFDDFEALAGLVAEPDAAHNIYNIPLVPHDFARRLGTSIIDTENGPGVSFSCAACHMGELFGVPVPGLTNRFPRANEFFVTGKKALGLVEPHLASAALGLSSESRRMLQSVKRSLARVEARLPAKDGLDTSLAHVALSLSHRQKDAYATPSGWFETFPRPDAIRPIVSDSKPAPWWNVKYKNKFLLDGSVVSGNPIYTNILWNEIGRGTDLKVLETWLDQNQQAIDELTAAVFSTRAPRYTDFFPAASLDLASAQRGQKLFNGNCVRCHGTYDKAWDQPDAALLSAEGLLATTRVRYFTHTPVIDVGTDPQRAASMKSLLQLNDLAISQRKGVLIQVQSGYVPPPLEGIWARWPYFHNNAAPSLCAVLTAGDKRPTTYFAGEARDKDLDFDTICNGYPEGDQVPPEWKIDPARRYNSTLAGLSNKGHDEGIFLKDGQEMYSEAQKADLIMFLKTL